jgi:thiamine biosynthesis lipoprotein
VGAASSRDEKSARLVIVGQAQDMAKIYLTIAIFISLTFAYPDCKAKEAHLIQGRTMGTFYQVQVVAADSEGLSGLKQKIEDRLVEINNSMSTYLPQSEISRFNSFHRAGVKFKISDDFYRVMRVAQKIYRLSEGAWDGTVNPLVDLWGFGRDGIKNAIPAETEIQRLRASVGFHHIEIVAPGYLIKRQAQITLDLSSIAKGYGVDAVAAVLRKAGFENFLVEIGGEIFAAGLRKDGKYWRIGINSPSQDAAINDVYKVVNLKDKAFATSGDYRIFFESEGVRYSHVIDPNTGYPVSNGVVSVSIQAGDCAFADGLATAVMVMGHKKGLALINRLDGVEGLIVLEEPDGRLRDYFSKGFTPGD